MTDTIPQPHSDGLDALDRGVVEVGQVAAEAMSRVVALEAKVAELTDWPWPASGSAGRRACAAAGPVSRKARRRPGPVTSRRCGHEPRVELHPAGAHRRRLGCRHRHTDRSDPVRVHLHVDGLSAAERAEVMRQLRGGQ
jgi:hypothetical protein